MQRKRRNEELLECAMSGRHREVARLLEEGADIATQDGDLHDIVYEYGQHRPVQVRVTLNCMTRIATRTPKAMILTSIVATWKTEQETRHANT